MLWPLSPCGLDWPPGRKPIAGLAGLQGCGSTVLAWPQRPATCRVSTGPRDGAASFWLASRRDSEEARGLQGLPHPLTCHRPLCLLPIPGPGPWSLSIPVCQKRGRGEHAGAWARGEPAKWVKSICSVQAREESHLCLAGGESGINRWRRREGLWAVLTVEGEPALGPPVTAAPPCSHFQSQPGPPPCRQNSPPGDSSQPGRGVSGTKQRLSPPQRRPSETRSGKCPGHGAETEARPPGAQHHLQTGRTSCGRF